jgi:hypothetical protein
MSTGMSQSVVIRLLEVSMKRIWIGRILAGLVSLFFLFDAGIKFAKPPQVMQAFVQSGWPAELSVPIGAILLACTILFIIPQTSVFGGILLTGYLGGALATNLRLELPLFTNILFPIYFGVAVWASLLLRYPRIIDFVPLIKQQGN